MMNEFRASSLPILLMIAYVMLGFIVRGAWVHLSADEQFVYRFVFPIHSGLIRWWTAEHKRRRFSFPKIDSPIAELLGFCCFAAGIVCWFNSREEIETFLRGLFP